MIKQLSAAAELSPIVIAGSPLAAGMISGIRACRGGSSLYERLMSPVRTSLGKTVVVKPTHRLQDLLPEMHLSEPPLDTALSKALFARFDVFSVLLTRQSELAKIVASEALGECIVLVIADGLSYRDFPRLKGVEPCLVDAPTNTESGHRNIVGTPHIAHQLYTQGYKRFYGFSFWERDSNPIASWLYDCIPDTEQYRAFDQVLSRMEALDLSRAYVQLSVAGLDDYAHHLHDTPLIAPAIDRIVAWVHCIVEILSRRGIPGRVYLTSDHGILWVKSPKDLMLVDSPEGYSVRYCRGAFASSFARFFPAFGQSSLRYPCVFRRPRIHEAGVHGGISCEESLVPFYRTSTWEG